MTLKRMGRTKRRRNRVRREKVIVSFSDVIALQNSLKLKCKNIQISYFKDTGRGVKCKSKLEKGDILIALPLRHLITSQTPTDIFSIFNIKSGIPHLDLTTFLIYESHLQEESIYFKYINTLPQTFTNLYFCSAMEIEVLPDLMRKSVMAQRKDLEKMYKRLNDILTDQICPHCNTSLKKFFSNETFTWAWFAVNTRSVYYKNDFKENQSMALAPFLDMFNHSNDALTEMSIDFENKLYILRTLVTFKKFKEIFIKYGPHSNLKLLLDYGFITANNPHDFIEFNFQEVIDFVRHFDPSSGEMTKTKYNFILKNNLDKNLTKNKDEFSWNFNGLIYVLITKDQNSSKLRAKTYSNQFSSSETLILEKIQKIAAETKINEFKMKLKEMYDLQNPTDSFRLATKLLEIYIDLLLKSST